MRKIISISLSLLILLSTVGFSINTHYCANKASASISFTTPHSCCGEKKMPSNCCKNVSKFVQLKANYNTTQIVQVPRAISFNSIIFFIQLYNFSIENSRTLTTSFFIKAPPLITIPLTVLHSIFLIWDHLLRLSAFARKL